MKQTGGIAKKEGEQARAESCPGKGNAGEGRAPIPNETNTDTAHSEPTQPSKSEAICHRDRDAIVGQQSERFTPGPWQDHRRPGLSAAQTMSV